MDLPHTYLSLPELKIRLAQAIQKEQSATYDLLVWLAEVDRRRAYAEWGYDSLWKMLLDFGYSESTASERIGALRLMQKVPNAEAFLKQGKLSFTTASRVARFIRKENKEHGHLLLLEEKTNLVMQSVGKSKTQLEELFCKTIALKDPVRSMESNKTRTLAISPTFEAKINRMREIKGHDLSHEFLLELALDAWLGKNDSDQKFGQKRATKTLNVPNKRGEEKLTEKKQEMENGKPNLSHLVKKNFGGEFVQQNWKRRSRYIPVEVKRTVYARDEGKCVECGTKSLIQFDHRQRFVHFGEQTADNLELRCRAHNLSRG